MQTNTATFVVHNELMSCAAVNTAYQSELDHGRRLDQPQITTAEPRAPRARPGRCKIKPDPFHRGGRHTS